MDMLKTVREIGFFETGCNLVEVIASKDVQAKAGVVMPLPEQVLVDSISGYCRLAGCLRQREIHVPFSGNFYCR